MLFAYIGYPGPCSHWTQRHASPNGDTVVYVADRHDLAGLVDVVVVVEAIANRAQQDAFNLAEEMVMEARATWWDSP